MWKFDIRVLAFIFVVIYVVLRVYCFIAYFGKPIAEVPMWVWFIIGGK